MRMSQQRAAESVGKFLYERKGQLLTVEEIAAGTRLTVAQVRGAEQQLKAFCAQHRREFAGYTLFIALGRDSRHGFVTDSTATLADVVARAKYMQTRAGTELNYAVQAGDRVDDVKVKRLLRRARTQQRAVVETMEAVYDLLTSQPELLLAEANGEAS